MKHTAKPRQACWRVLTFSAAKHRKEKQTEENQLIKTRTNEQSNLYMSFFLPSKGWVFTLNFVNYTRNPAWSRSTYMVKDISEKWTRCQMTNKDNYWSIVPQKSCLNRIRVKQTWWFLSVHNLEKHRSPDKLSLTQTGSWASKQSLLFQEMCRAKKVAVSIHYLSDDDKELVIFQISSTCYVCLLLYLEREEGFWEVSRLCVSPLHLWTCASV